MLFVLSLENILSLRVFLFEHFNQEAVMSSFTRAQVRLGAHEQVVRAKSNQIVFADLNVRLVNIHWLENFFRLVQLTSLSWK